MSELALAFLRIFILPLLSLTLEYSYIHDQDYLYSTIVHLSSATTLAASLAIVYHTPQWHPVQVLQNTNLVLSSSSDHTYSHAM